VNLRLYPLLFLGFLYPSAFLFSAQFLAVTTVPEDGILNPQPSQQDGSLSIFFSADLSGTVTFSAYSFSPTTISYSTPGATMGVTFPATDFSLVNEFFPITLRLVASDNSQAVTEVTIAIDATPPPPPSGITILPADRALFIYWDPAIPFPPPFDRNVDSYRLYYSGAPITDTLAITSTSENNGTRVGFPDPNSPGAGITAVTFLYSDHYFLENLNNNQQYYLTLEAIDHAGNRSGVRLLDNGKPAVFVGYPTETSTFSELTGVKDQCFVVTAAFGNPASLWVRIYRLFRDRFILLLPGGKALVRFYYGSLGPKGARWLIEHPRFRTIASTLLILSSPFILLLAFLTPSGCLILLAGILLYYLQKKHIPKRSFLSLSPLLFLFYPSSSPGVETFSLKLSPFYPSKVTGVAPNQQVIRYQDLYGSTGTFRIDLEYTYYLTFLGEWGAGGSLGFATDAGKALALQSDGYVPSGEPARMNFLPLSAFLRYRAHYFENQPLILTLYGGGEAFGIQETRRRLSNSIQTYAFGYSYGGEVELLLDLLDSDASAYMENNYSIKDTTLFFGYSIHRINNLKFPSTLDLSYRGWIAGLRFVY
jgi:hypothetical protein